MVYRVEPCLSMKRTKKNSKWASAHTKTVSMLALEPLLFYISCLYFIIYYFLDSIFSVFVFPFGVCIVKWVIPSIRRFVLIFISVIASFISCSLIDRGIFLLSSYSYFSWDYTSRLWLALYLGRYLLLIVFFMSAPGCYGFTLYLLFEHVSRVVGVYSSYALYACMYQFHSTFTSSHTFLFIYAKGTMIRLADYFYRSVL